MGWSKFKNTKQLRYSACSIFSYICSLAGKGSDPVRIYELCCNSPLMLILFK